jgi:hypothetical protein
MGRFTGPNRQYISDVKKIAETRPELVPRIRCGELTISGAKKELDRPEEAYWLIPPDMR